MPIDQNQIILVSSRLNDQLYAFCTGAQMPALVHFTTIDKQTTGPNDVQ